MDAAANLTCPVCHVEVKSSDYFCANCGHNLKPTPPSTTVTTQLKIYLGSVFLPPIGLIWGVRYLKIPNQKSKIIGIIAIVLTIISLIVTTIVTINFINNLNQQVDKQLQMYQQFY